MSDEIGGAVIGEDTSTHNAPLPDQAAITPQEPMSASDSVKAAFDKVMAESDKPEEPEEVEEKPAKPEKAEKAEKQAKSVKSEAPEEAEEETEPEEASKARKEAKPKDPPAGIPSRLLPKARDVWMNTPRVVQAEFERMETEHAAEIEKYRAAHEFADEIADYRQMAEQAGTTVKAALDRYVAFDRQIMQDFGKGIVALAGDQGKQPIEVISSILRAYGVTPQQYAQHVTANPQSHQMQPAPQQPVVQRDPSGQQALRELQEIKRAMQIQQIETQIIAPIMPQMPRYAELQNDIAFFLQSGKVPNSLSPADRVLTAYDMAERLNPSPVTATQERADPDPSPVDMAGRKSISGAPGSGAKLKGKPKIMSLKESIDDAMRRV